MKPIFNSISDWFGIIMVLVVVSGAMAFAFTDMMTDRLWGSRRTFFVFLLLAYGIYRSFRLYQNYKRRNYED